MEWDDGVRQRVIDAMEKVQPGGVVCPVCGSRGWAIQPGFVQLGIAENLESVQLGGKYAPSAAINCQTCGFTLLMNLITLGVVPRDQPDEGVDPDDESAQGDEVAS